MCRAPDDRQLALRGATQNAGRFVGRICRVPSPPGLVDGLPPNRRNPTRGVIQYTEGSTTRKIDFEMPQVTLSSTFYPFVEAACVTHVVPWLRLPCLCKTQCTYTLSRVHRSQSISVKRSTLRNAFLGWVWK